MDAFTERIRKYEPFFGEWALGDEIGRGSFGRVFTVYHKNDGDRNVAALKVISIPQSPEEVQELMVRFGGREEMVRAKLRRDYEYSYNETQVMEKLKGISNIVYFEQYAIYERTDTYGWDILIRMERVTRLDDYLKDDMRRRDLDTVYRIFIDILEGLKVCQTNGLVHMDIKPENIFYSPNIDYFKLGDFGEAQYVNYVSGLAAVGKTVGSYSYMAPEVRQGKGADFSTDVYSTALVMYQLLNDDRLPFAHKAGPLTEQDYETINNTRWSGQSIPRLKNVPKEFMDYLLKCLDPNPQNRFRNAAQAQEALRLTWYNMSTTSGGGAKKWIVLGVTLVVLAGGVATLGILNSRQQENPPAIVENADAPVSEVTDTPTPELATETPVPEVSDTPTPVPSEAAEETVTVDTLPPLKQITFPETGMALDSQGAGSATFRVDTEGYDGSSMTARATVNGQPVSVEELHRGELYIAYSDPQAAWGDEVDVRLTIESPELENGAAQTQALWHWTNDEAGRLVLAPGPAGEVAPIAVTAEEGMVDGVVAAGRGLSLSGTAQAGLALQAGIYCVEDGRSSVLGQVAVEGDGSWRFDVPLTGLQDGRTYRLDLAYENGAGASVSGSAFHYAGPIETLSVNQLRVTDQQAAGRTKPGVRVTLALNGELLAEGNASLSGEFMLPLGNGGLEARGLTVGQEVQVTADDGMGNQRTEAVVLQDKDRIPLTLTFPGAQTVDEASGEVTVYRAYMNALEIHGEAGEPALLYFDDDVIGDEKVLDDTGAYSLGWSTSGDEIRMQVVYAGTEEKQSPVYTVRYSNEPLFAELTGDRTDPEGNIRPDSETLTGRISGEAGSLASIRLLREEDQALLAEAQAKLSGEFTLEGLSLAPETEYELAAYSTRGELLGRERFTTGEEALLPLTVSSGAPIEVDGNTIAVPEADWIDVLIHGTPGQQVVLEGIKTDGSSIEYEETLNAEGTLDQTWTLYGEYYADLSGQDVKIRLRYPSTGEAYEYDILWREDEPLFTLAIGEGGVTPETDHLSGHTLVPNGSVFLTDAAETDAMEAEASVDANGDFTLEGLSLAPNTLYFLFVYDANNLNCGKTSFATSEKALLPLNVVSPAAETTEAGGLILPAGIRGVAITGEPGETVAVDINGSAYSPVALDANGQGWLDWGARTTDVTLTLRYEGREAVEIPVIIDEERPILQLDTQELAAETEALRGWTALPGGRLTLTDEAGSVIAETTADGAGDFTFEGLALSEQTGYTVTVSDDSGHRLGRATFGTAQRAFAPLSLISSAAETTEAGGLILPAGIRGVGITGEPGETVAVTINGSPYSPVTLDANGQGWLDFGARTTDVALTLRYEGREAVEIPAIIDEGRPILQLDAQELAAEAEVLSGWTAQPEGRLTLTDEAGNVVAEAVAQEDGSFYFEGLSLSEQAGYTVAVTDDSGHLLGRATFGTSQRAFAPIVLDNLSVLELGEGSFTLPLADGYEFRLEGEPNEDVELIVNGESSASLTFDAQGQARWTLTGVSAGETMLTARYLNNDAFTELRLIIDGDRPLARPEGPVLPSDTEIRCTAAVSAPTTLYREDPWEFIAEAQWEDDEHLVFSGLSLEPETTYQIRGTEDSAWISFTTERAAFRAIEVVVDNEQLQDGSCLLDAEGALTLRVQGEPGQEILVIPTGEKIVLDDSGELRLSVPFEPDETKNIILRYTDERPGNAQATWAGEITARSADGWSVALDDAADLTPGTRAFTGTSSLPDAEIALIVNGETRAEATADGEGRFDLGEVTLNQGDQVTLTMAWQGSVPREMGSASVRALGELAADVMRFRSGKAVVTKAEDGEEDLWFYVAGEVGQRYEIFLDGEPFAENVAETDEPGDYFSYGTSGTEDGHHVLSIRYADDPASEVTIEYDVDKASQQIHPDPLMAGEQVLTGTAMPGLELRVEELDLSATVGADGRFAFPEAAYEAEVSYSLTAWYEGYCVARYSLTAAGWADITLEIPEGVLSGQNSIELTGSAQSGEALILWANGEEIGRVASEDGRWSALLTADLLGGDGEYEIRVSYADYEGGGATGTLLKDTACALSAETFHEDDVRLTGSADPGARIVLQNTQTGVTWGATADEGGRFEIDLKQTLSRDGQYALTAEDPYGNKAEPVALSIEETARRPMSVWSDMEKLTGGDAEAVLRLTAEPGLSVSVRGETDAGEEILRQDLTAEEGETLCRFPLEGLPSGTTGVTFTFEYADGFGQGAEWRFEADIQGPELHPDAVSAGDEVLRGTVSGAMRVWLTVNGEEYTDSQEGNHAEGEGESFAFRLDAPLSEGESLQLCAEDANGNRTEMTLTAGSAAQAAEVTADLSLAIDQGGDSFAVGETFTVSGGTGLTGDDLNGVVLQDADTGEELSRFSRRTVRDYFDGSSLNQLPIEIESALSGHEVRLVLEMSNAGVLPTDIVFHVGEGGGTVNAAAVYTDGAAFGFDTDQNVRFAPGSPIFLTGWRYGSQGGYRISTLKVTTPNGQVLKEITMSDSTDASLSQNGLYGRWNRSTFEIYQNYASGHAMPAAPVIDGAGFYVYIEPGALGMPLTAGTTYRVELRMEGVDDVASVEIAIDPSGQVMGGFTECAGQAVARWNQGLAAMPQPTATPAP